MPARAIPMYVDKFTILWFGCGINGVIIACIKEGDKMKDMHPIPLWLGVLAGIACGPLTLIACFKPDIWE